MVGSELLYWLQPWFPGHGRHPWAPNCIFRWGGLIIRGTSTRTRQRSIIWSWIASLIVSLVIRIAHQFYNLSSAFPHVFASSKLHVVTPFIKYLQYLLNLQRNSLCLYHNRNAFIISPPLLFLPQGKELAWIEGLQNHLSVGLLQLRYSSLDGCWKHPKLPGLLSLPMQLMCHRETQAPKSTLNKGIS